MRSEHRAAETLNCDTATIEQILAAKAAYVAYGSIAVVLSRMQGPSLMMTRPAPDAEAGTWQEWRAAGELFLVYMDEVHQSRPNGEKMIDNIRRELLRKHGTGFRPTPAEVGAIAREITGNTGPEYVPGHAAQARQVVQAPKEYSALPETPAIEGSIDDLPDPWIGDAPSALRSILLEKPIGEWTSWKDVVTSVRSAYPDIAADPDHLVKLRDAARTLWNTGRLERTGSGEGVRVRLPASIDAETGQQLAGAILGGGNGNPLPLGRDRSDLAQLDAITRTIERNLGRAIPTRHLNASLLQWRAEAPAREAERQAGREAREAAMEALANRKRPEAQEASTTPTETQKQTERQPELAAA